MFLPQGAEVDCYDKNGQQIDDINSVVEYVEVALGYDHTADDEDDDSGQNFHIVKAFDYYFEQKVVVLETEKVQVEQSVTRHFDHAVLYTQTCYLDIPTPPPNITV
jgi:hypothetical protein